MMVRPTTLFGENRLSNLHAYQQAGLLHKLVCASRQAKAKALYHEGGGAMAFEMM